MLERDTHVELWVRSSRRWDLQHCLLLLSTPQLLCVRYHAPPESIDSRLLNDSTSLFRPFSTCFGRDMASPFESHLTRYPKIPATQQFLPQNRSDRSLASQLNRRCRATAGRDRRQSRERIAVSSDTEPLPHFPPVCSVLRWLAAIARSLLSLCSCWWQQYFRFVLSGLILSVTEQSSFKRRNQRKEKRITRGFV